MHWTHPVGGRILAAMGIAVLRFDFTGLGQSEGEFADTNFTTNVGDLLAAVRFLEEEYAAPALLLGHSLGGTAVLQAAHDIPSAVAVATIGSPADPEHVTHLFGEQRDELEAAGEVDVQLGGRPFTIKKQFVEDLAAHPMPESVGSLRKAIMILHAPLDDVVELDNASQLFAAAKHPKSFVSLDKADHLLTRDEDSRYAGEIIAAWAAKYLPEDAEDEQPAVPEGVVVARTDAGGFRTDIHLGKHHITADEPASVGGTNLGPTPYGLLSAALAACTTMTLQMYAKHKKLDLQAATVEVKHDKVHAQDAGNQGGKIDSFKREIFLEGDLDAEQRQRLLEIADKCPVHQTLERSNHIETVLGQ